VGAAPISFHFGGGAFGVPFVKFTLTYDGPLPPSANKPKNQDKWDIRRKLDPQFRDLWSSHPALRFVAENRHFPKTGGTTLTQVHHLHPGPIIPKAQLAGPEPEVLDLCESIEKFGAWFCPLVRESYALHCGLKVLFLRKEPPGKIYQGGDIDGRIKTLLDALAMPTHREQILEVTKQTEPIYCLMENDSLVSGLQVESERLLTDQTHQKDFVSLIIEVDVRIYQPAIYNQSFLG
jgi:hypothetical protein